MTVYLIVSKENEMLLLCGHPFTDGGQAFAYAKDCGFTNYAVAERIVDLMA
jgi:hypothetical protein